MRSFVSTYKYLLLLILLFIVSEILVNPSGNFPLNDDWTYGKSVLILQKEGKLTVGEFAAMSLFSHIVWGYMFTKAFWFSFTILRISTLISSLIGLITLHHLIISFSGNRPAAFIACLTLLFSPIYFNLSNTFMTDVNFNTLFLLGCYFAFRFFKTGSHSAFVLVFVMSALLVLVRQFGIILPASFTFACLFRVEKKWIYAGLSLLAMLLVYGIFKYYEAYLKNILSSAAAYKFSGNVDPTGNQFWISFRNNWILRYRKILLHVLGYSSPVALFFIPELLRSTHKALAILLCSISCISVYYLFEPVNFPIGNVFTNMALGAETFFESLDSSDKNPLPHTYSASFGVVMALVKYTFSAISLSAFLLWASRALRSGKKLCLQPEIIMLLSFFSAYVLMILITESYFDRYHLPLITVMLLLFSFLGKNVNRYSWLAILPLGFFFYVSVFGTKDYIELNRNKWDAYAYLKENEKALPETINGGFEINCWNDGQYTWWSDFLSVDRFDYLIQYRAEPGFELYKEYEFQRYFPYKKDKVCIYKKISGDTIQQ